MQSRFLKTTLTLILFIATAAASQAVTMAQWQNVNFFGSSRNEIIAALGQPDDADKANEMDTFLVSDSPDLMLLGMLGYKNDKVTAVFVVCQPSVTYTQARDMQIKNPDLKLVSEDKRGILFAYVKPQPNGARFMAITHSDDKAMGPMLSESIDDPYAEGDSSDNQQAAPAPAPAAPTASKELDTGVLILDIFDWNAPDENGKEPGREKHLAIIRRIKALWRATGAETDQNDVPAETILDKIVLGEQANIFECACKVVGINPEPFWKLREQ